MVRGAAALLAASAVSLAYALSAGRLPDIGDGNGAVIAAAGAGLIAVSVVTLAAAATSELLLVAALFACGAGLLAGALDDAGVNAAAIVPEAVFAGAFGALLGRWLLGYAGVAVAIAVPVFVALVDVWSVAIGPSSRLAGGDPRGAAVLAFDLPSWGGALAGPAARLGLPDAIFLAAFATWAVRLELRPRLTAVTMTCALVATMVVSVTANRTIPALPLLAIGFLLPNADRLVVLLRKPAER